MFAIFIPKTRGEATEQLRRVGADWALDPSVTAMGVDVFEGGPDGGGGLLVYFDRRGRFSSNAIVSIDLDAQQWLPAAPDGERGAGRYWVGVWKAQKPSPEDLARETLTDGPAVELRNSGVWVVPVADYLPKLCRLNRQTGEQELQPLPEHATFIEKTNALFRLLVSDNFHKQLEETMRVVIPNGLRYAADALAVNYRINLDLLDMLDAIGEFEAVKIAGVATGLELIASSEKKSALLAMRSCGS